MKCWKCHVVLDIPEDKVHFRTTCDACSTWLHCCRNCKNYKPGMPNDCLIPDTDQIRNRETANFCDEFSPLKEGKPSPPSDASDVETKLFGDASTPPLIKGKDAFDHLFKDES